MPREFHTIVIGGGITGLCVAQRLRETLGPDSVLLLESGEEAGGYCKTDHIDGFTCDWGPNGFLDKEPKLLDWVERLGISGELTRANESSSRRFIMLNDRLVEILPPPRFLLSPLLGPLGKLRLFMEPLIPQRTDPAPESIYDFAKRRIGRQAADNLVSAMVLGVFGGDAQVLSLEHCFPVMAEMEREYGGLVKALIRKPKTEGGGPMGPRGTLTTLRKGIGALTETAAQSLGDSLRLDAPVKNIAEDNGYRVETLTGEVFKAEQVVLALPAPRAAEISQGLGDKELSRNLGIIQHASMAVVTTGYPIEKVGRDLDGFGFLTPPNQGKRALGCLWTSSIFDGFAPEGYAYLRTLIGGARDPDAVRLEDDELLDVVKSDVHPVMKIDSAPEFVKIFRHRIGIPQYGLNHGEILEALSAAQARHPGLHLVGNAHRGVSLNDCVVSAYETVAAISD